MQEIYFNIMKTEYRPEGELVEGEFAKVQAEFSLRRYLVLAFAAGRSF